MSNLLNVKPQSKDIGKYLYFIFDLVINKTAESRVYLSKACEKGFMAINDGNRIFSLHLIKDKCFLIKCTQKV